MGRNRFASLLMVAPVAALMPGCVWIDDTSDDNYLYKSTPHLPVTVTLVDTRTNEEVWSQDVPVGSNLKLAFKRNGSADDPYGDSQMVWQWKGRARQAGETRGDVIVPTRDVRRIDVTYRDPVERYVPVPEPMFEPVLAPIDEPVAEEPVAEEPLAEEAVIDETVIEEPAMDEPAAGEPIVGEPAAEEATDEGDAEVPESEPAAADPDDEELDLPPLPPAPTS